MANGEFVNCGSVGVSIEGVSRDKNPNMLAEGNDVDVPDSNVGLDQNSLDFKLWGVKEKQKSDSIWMW